MIFVTRKGVRLDRAACAWLIRRHIAPDAEIRYLEVEELPQAVEEGAIVFHNTISEEQTARERTSFQELLVEYRLDERDEGLALMGDIVRGAETKEPGSIEEAEGLRAIAKGMNALAGSDEEMVERMLPVFDALYAYCQRRVQGQRNWANAGAGWGRREEGSDANSPESGSGASV
ncbi:MAG TPA: chromate resistance protein ChrB domain-containing protein [Chloroflexia bacterium]|nr:chromate resistance protein ChrB domain-containing protein [Chloroflexia bacterium]